MANFLRKGTQRLELLRRKLASGTEDIYTGSAPLGAKQLVVIAADVDPVMFDKKMVRMLREEGFSVTCLPPIKSSQQFTDLIEKVDDELERSDFYALIAFGKAASIALQQFEKPAWPNLRAMVAYYPNKIGHESSFPDNFHVRIHLANTQNPSADYAGAGYYCYQYPFSHSGFAECNNANFDEIDARLAWSRTLAALRQGFDIPNYIEHVWDQYLRMDHLENTLGDSLQTLSRDVYVNYVPVILGGRGRGKVFNFHEKYFRHQNPSSLSMRLVSRTVGSDHIVDEVHVAFRHTEEIPWLLPDIPPTGKDVEIIIVTIATIHGGEITHIQTHWDQASMLMQLGLLDPRGLPIHGGESAAKVLDEGLPFKNKHV
ncbi:hypothetical protein KEM56_007694 [Ascosphaera pollenicola]|nr:hypothetical protein KEM56_007694 [Ascosphaera pollenicola]